MRTGVPPGFANISSTRLVSICIPVFNAAPYLAAALDSVLEQSYARIEVIAVNDGSTDASRDILGRYEKRIKIVDQPNGGQCAAANRAFRESRGDLIKFFDADDVMAPDMIAAQVERLGRHDDAVAMGEWTRFFGEKPENETFARLPMYRDADPADWLTDEWMDAQPMMQCGLWLIPRRIIDRAGLWDERLSLINDFEYYARILTAAKEIRYAQKARFFYRSGLSNSLSGRKGREAVESQLLSLLLGTQHLLAVRDTALSRRACANVLAQFNYEHYPDYVDLRARACKRANDLGGADISPIGPPNFHRLRRLVGWRAARRLQIVLGRR